MASEPCIKCGSSIAPEDKEKNRRYHKNCWKEKEAVHLDTWGHPSRSDL